MSINYGIPTTTSLNVSSDIVIGLLSVLNKEIQEFATEDKFIMEKWYWGPTQRMGSTQHLLLVPIIKVFVKL